MIDIYAPCWFDVVQNQSFLDGPRIFHRLVASLNASKDFKAKERKVLEDCINWNSYMAHPENVLISMLTNVEHLELRKKAARIINAVKARGPREGVRIFVKPKVDWKAESYDQISEDQKPEEMDLEPPVTMDLSPEQIDAIAETPILFDMAHLPCHMQAVERCIKDVTFVAKEGYSIGVHPKLGNRFEQAGENILPWKPKSFLDAFCPDQETLPYLSVANWKGE